MNTGTEQLREQIADGGGWVSHCWSEWLQISKEVARMIHVILLQREISMNSVNLIYIQVDAYKKKVLIESDSTLSI